MSGPLYGPLSDEEAVREVAWIARRARELALTGRPEAAPAAEYAEFFGRKVRLLEHIGTAESLALVPANLELHDHYLRQLSPPNNEDPRSS